MITVGFGQFCPVRCDVAQNVKAVRRLLRGVRAEVMVLPELANSGYQYANPSELAPFAEDASGRGPFLSGLRELARESRGVIVAGFAEAAPEGLYNSAALVDGDGVCQVYRKTHLFQDEQDLFLPGDTGFQVLDYHGVRIGTMICFDWLFPESARTLALRGAQIIAHPANLVMPWCQQAMVTRSLENAVFSITANRYGTETLNGQTLIFTGGSQALDVKGRCLVRALNTGDYVAICDIDPLAADDKAINSRNHLFANRRPEMYAEVPLA
jgi:predicted amidohydrolase